ncbi:MAG: YlbF family regulator [Ignavibacteriales bacterium]
MNVYDKSHELARAIRESEENREYKKVRSQVYSNEKNKILISDFKVKQFEIQAEQLTGKEPDKEKVEQLQSLYAILTANPEIGKYFEIEYKFEKLISDVYKILGEAIDIDSELIK